MLFSSVIFLFLFLPVVLTLYFLVPGRFRNAYLLAASLLFYAWGEIFYVLVMLFSIGANYLFGLWVRATSDRKKSKRRVVVAIVLNTVLLCAFKYTNFIVANVNALLGALGFSPIAVGHVHLPLGISFFTFQAMSYVIDAYRGRVEPEKRIVNVALYIALFPQLIAGPIVRYRDIAAQIVKRHVDWEDLVYGIQRFIIGLAKKVLLANTAGAMVDRIHEIPHGQMPADVAWVGGAYYMLQLYFDFSGYSDMAIGLGRMFGFRLLENFNYPYISKTLTEFWQRWHISLSTWFRDYLFTPLGSYRLGRGRAYLNLMVVFFLCGIWHGAAWNFVVFGVMQGGIMAIERLLRAKRRPFFAGKTGYLYHLLVIHFTFVMFRSETLGDAWWYYKSMFGLLPDAGLTYHLGLYLTPELVVVGIVGSICSLPILPWIRRRLAARTTGAPRPGPGMLGVTVVGMALLAALFTLCAVKLAAGTYNPFIYFRF